jgi:predicted anti-sigma-YlaC factor YlaD
MAQVLAPGARQGAARILVALLGLFTLYVVGLDQGQLLSLVQGNVAFDQNLIHEAIHDARHAAGFPCH